MARIPNLLIEEQAFQEKGTIAPIFRALLSHQLFDINLSKHIFQRTILIWNWPVTCYRLVSLFVLINCVRNTDRKQWGKGRLIKCGQRRFYNVSLADYLVVSLGVPFAGQLVAVRFFFWERFLQCMFKMSKQGEEVDRSMHRLNQRDHFEEDDCDGLFHCPVHTCNHDGSLHRVDAENT